MCSTRYFYPRPPGGGRRTRRGTMDIIYIFLSTPSGWRATSGGFTRIPILSDFYPRPPGGGRLSALISLPSASNFYPRPPGGGRHFRSMYQSYTTQFLSTPSGWRATFEKCSLVDRSPLISIHALRVEGDSKNGQSFRLFLRKREKNLPL